LQRIKLDKPEVYRAIALLVQGAAAEHYLNEKNNVVLATVTPSSKVAVVDEEKLQALVSDTVASLPLPVKVITGEATPGDRKEAAANGISVGRYLIYKESARQGGKISIEDLKTKGLGQLEKEKGIEIQQLLPKPKYKMKDAQKYDDRDQKTTPATAPDQLKKGKQRDRDTDVNEPALQDKDRINERDEDLDKEKKSDVDEIKHSHNNTGTGQRRDNRRSGRLEQNQENEKEHRTSEDKGGDDENHGSKGNKYK